MRRRTFFIAMLGIVSVLVVGCASKEERISTLKTEAQALVSEKKYDDAIAKYDEILKVKSDPIYVDEQKDMKIQKLKDKALEAVSVSNFSEAITSYEEILRLKDDESFKTALNDIKIEKTAVDGVKKYYTELYDIQKNRTRSGITVKPTDMEYIIKDLRTINENFEKLDTTKHTDIAKHINKIKDNLSYKLFKNQLDSKLFNDSGISEGLGELDSQLKTLNTITVAYARNQINDAIDDIIALKIPSKYDQ